jgi:hypothetical protein
MARWKRRLITEAALGLLLIIMYLQMIRLGLSRHTILLAFGGSGIACGLTGLALKPDEKFAELIGRDGETTRIAYNIGWIVLGSALLAWALLVMRSP